MQSRTNTHHVITSQRTPYTKIHQHRELNGVFFFLFFSLSSRHFAISRYSLCVCVCVAVQWARPPFQFRFGIQIFSSICVREPAQIVSHKIYLLIFVFCSPLHTLNQWIAIIRSPMYEKMNSSGSLWFTQRSLLSLSSVVVGRRHGIEFLHCMCRVVSAVTLLAFGTYSPSIVSHSIPSFIRFNLFKSFSGCCHEQSQALGIVLTAHLRSIQTLPPNWTFIWSVFVYDDGASCVRDLIVNSFWFSVHCEFASK